MSGSLIMLIAFCSIALIVVIGICFTANMSQRARGLALGIGAIALTALVVVYFSVKPMLNAPAEPAQRFVAYFENAGGIEAGDVVRIKGRRAGRVVASEVVHRDGKVMIRVEFEIAPGSGSQWLKEGGIPEDSSVRVRQASIIGRPSLNIVYGDGDKLIPEGGEWKDAEGLSGEDRFESWLREIRRFDAAIDKYMGYVRPDMIAEIKLNIAQLRLTIDNVRTEVERGVSIAHEIVARIDQLSRAVATLNEEMHDRAPKLSKSLESFSAQLKDVPKFSASALDSVSKLRADIAGLSDTLAENAQRAENGDLDKILREFRRFAAQLRGGAQRAEYNPKQAGDMPPWRFARPFFNGGSSALEAADIAEKGGSSDYKELPQAPKPRPKPKTED